MFYNSRSLKDEEGQSPTERDLKNLKEALQNEAIVGPLIRKCCTMDQVYRSATCFARLLLSAFCFTL